MKNPQLATRGKVLYEEGNAAAGVPGCVGCHQPNVVGTRRYPRLAGQLQTYVVQQLMNYGRAGDLVIAISGSGNSPNVLTAVEWANRHGLTTYGLTGYRGGHLKEIQRDGLHVELDDMGMVESIHLCVFHWVLNDVFARINGEGRHAAA